MTTHIILFDNEVRDRLLPLTFTRPVAELRMGILTIKEKWEKWMKGKVSYITQDYLAAKYPMEHGEVNYIVNGSALPSAQLCKLLKQMDFSEAFLQGDELIAAKLNREQLEQLIENEDFGNLKGYDVQDTNFIKINALYDLFRLNDLALASDFTLLTKERKSQPISKTNQVINPENIFLERGAKVEYATLNASAGPIYISEDAEIMEGALIRGGLALGQGSEVRMGTKIYGPTTIGPGSKVGGEIKNIVIQANSNKVHNGYLANSVLGEWCNLGAGTNVANRKNNYSPIKLWNYESDRFLPTGLDTCGVIMGDFAKSAVNTTFNTGTVIGVSANVFGSGFPRNFIPSFAWGGSRGFSTFRIDQAVEAADRALQRRNLSLNVDDRLIFLRVFEETIKYRRWEELDE